MVAQHKKKSANFAFLDAYYPKTHLIKSLNFLDSSRPYERLIENEKTGGSRELFLLENDIQTSSEKNVPKNIQILEAWKPTKEKKFRLEFFCTCCSTYDFNIKIVMGT